MDIPLWFPNDAGTELSTLFVRPDGWIDVPMVVFCRGNTRGSAGDQDRQIAHLLEKQGIGSLLLDFSSADGQISDLTRYSLARLIGDLGSAIDELRIQRGVDVGRIGVCGSGVGGTVALLRSSIDPRIRALALRAPLAPTPPLPAATVTAPTLLVVGSNDQTAIGGIRRIERWLAGPSELLLIPDAGHQLGEPAAFRGMSDRVVDWFIRFLGTGVKVQAA